MLPVPLHPLSPLQYRVVTTIVIVMAMLLGLGFASLGHSAIFSCQSGDTTIFQDVPCPLKKPTETVKKTNNTYPLSIHKSWFDIPEQAQERAFCDRSGCECGRVVKKHQGSLIRAVAEALYLDGSWHRYESSYQEWLQTSSSSARSFEVREQMHEASCDVMMSQTLLRNYANDALAILKKHVRTAEERGYDVEQPCLDGITEACDYFDFVQHYQRIQKDAASLRRSRADSLQSITDIVNLSQ